MYQVFYALWNVHRSPSEDTSSLSFPTDRSSKPQASLCDRLRGWWNHLAVNTSQVQSSASFDERHGQAPQSVPQSQPQYPSVHSGPLQDATRPFSSNVQSPRLNFFKLLRVEVRYLLMSECILLTGSSHVIVP